MECVTIYLGLSDSIIHQADEAVIGVDRGALFLAEHKQMMILAYGDFDSVSPSELEIIKLYSKRVVEVKKEKDQTDSEGVLAYCKNYKEIKMVGGLGYRKDHEIINLNLCIQDHRITLYDRYNKIVTRSEGIYTIEKDKYKYLSLIPLGAGCVTIVDVRYPLIRREVSAQDLYLTSNEIIDEKAKLEIHRGMFLVIQSNDK